MLSPIVVVPEGADGLDPARQLAHRLNIPCVDQPPAHGLLLLVGRDGLALHDADAPREQPLRVDFESGSMGYRQRAGFRRDELLARAVGIKGGYLPSILDATAGLGRDAFMLASLGCELTLCERHPVVFALLEDGLCRAGQVPALAPVIGRMHLVAGDAAAYLDSAAALAPDVVVLDPMFPERGKSALVKKPMRLFHGLVGMDPDADGLLERAMAKARRRVVVKRPLHAPALGGLAPSLSYKGKAVRFDVYLTCGG
ncbi:class I SAM-dependent methyltransferase [Thiofaba sp. EF100]|uniref:class I SAM-dependent methyltransferase n=1 Tax=Thiofaba sp. EF100 TaxID=3121274 RepID=UPI0032220C99